mgnify:CR=1 FL=1
MVNYKIICVDDEDTFLPIYEKLLANLGYEVITFTSCLKALEYIKEHGKKIIYIFSDYQMPEMNGIDFRRKINQIADDIPFALVTGYYNLELAKSAMELQINSFVNKPVHSDDLKKLVSILGEKRKGVLKEETEMLLFTEHHDIQLPVLDITDKQVIHLYLLAPYSTTLATAERPPCC